MFDITMMLEGNNNWQMGWGNLEEVPYGTGLLEPVSQQLKKFTNEFLSQVNPDSLSVYGIGKGRNEFYASNCASWAPAGFGIEILESMGDKKIHGVRFVCLEPKNILKDSSTSALKY